MSEINYKDLVGKRLLIENKSYAFPKTREVKVLEVAPSGDYLKLEWNSGSEIWDKIKTFESEYNIVEVLNDVQPKVKFGARRTSGKVI
jgi:hypothetical protein